MIFVQPERNGVVEVRRVTNRDGMHADSRRLYAPSDHLMGTRVSEIEPGVYNDDGTHAGTFDDFFTRMGK